MKTCRDILKELYGRHVRIGFKNGTSFMYCNKVTDSTEAEIKAEQNKFVEKVRTSNENAKIDIANFESAGLEKFSYKMKKNGRRFSSKDLKERYNNLLNQKKNYIKKTEDRLIFITKICPDFILDCEVVEGFMSTDPEEPETVIILLNGDFDGDYWNEEEYLKVPFNHASEIYDEDCLNLACAVLSSAVKASDKKFFYSNTFGLYMPNYNGADIWQQLKKKGMVYERKGLYCSRL